MRELAWITLVVMAMVATSVPAQEVAIDARPDLQIDQEHTKWIDHVMRSIATIKPGMTRRELSKVFAGDGGISFRNQRRYVYKHCPLIKVDVEFSPLGDEEIGDGSPAVTEENPSDKIVKISRPFLEYSISD